MKQEQSLKDRHKKLNIHKIYFGMGNHQIQSLDNFPEDFKYVGTTKESPYRNACIYRNESAKFHVAMVNVPASQFDEATLKKFKGASPYLINLLDWCNEEQVALCGQQESVCIFYEYCPSNLEMEIRKQSIRNQRFKEEEVWYVLNSIVELEQCLSLKGMSHCDLRPCNILVSEQNVIKYAPVGLFPQDVNAYRQWLYLNQTTYLAPECCKMNLQKIDWPANDVFAAGLTLLDMMTLDFSMHLYNDQSKMQELIKQRLERASAHYSEGLCSLVATMLLSHSRRATFTSLQSALNPYQKQILSFTPFRYKSITSSSTASTRSLKSQHRVTHRMEPSEHSQQSSIKTFSYRPMENTVSPLRKLDINSLPTNRLTLTLQSIRKDISPIRIRTLFPRPRDISPMMQHANVTLHNLRDPSPFTPSISPCYRIGRKPSPVNLNRTVSHMVMHPQHQRVLSVSPSLPKLVIHSDRPLNILSPLTTLTRVSIRSPNANSGWQSQQRTTIQSNEQSSVDLTMDQVLQNTLQKAECALTQYQKLRKEL